jgi:hypothetical protein
MREPLFAGVVSGEAVQVLDVLFDFGTLGTYVP